MPNRQLDGRDIVASFLAWKEEHKAVFHITPPGGTVIDPFMGSGSTGCAALLEEFNFIGIEREAEYLEIARQRILHWAPMWAREVTE